MGSRAKLPLAPLVQGIVFIASGLWPVVHLESFERVTGRKIDGWLVKTVGGLIAVVGATLVTASVNRRDDTAVRVLGVGSALALALADIVYVSKRRIPPVYLADAALQTGLATAWFIPRARA